MGKGLWGKLYQAPPAPGAESPSRPPLDQQLLKLAEDLPSVLGIKASPGVSYEVEISLACGAALVWNMHSLEPQECYIPGDYPHRFQVRHQLTYTMSEIVPLAEQWLEAALVRRGVDPLVAVLQASEASVLTQALFDASVQATLDFIMEDLA